MVLLSFVTIIDAFMSALEADAENRRKRKQQATLEASAIKDMGNQEFKEGNYEKAVEYYTLVGKTSRLSNPLSPKNHCTLCHKE